MQICNMSWDERRNCAAITQAIQGRKDEVTLPSSGVTYRLALGWACQAAGGEIAEPICHPLQSPHIQPLLVLHPKVATSETNRSDTVCV